MGYDSRLYFVEKLPKKLTNVSLTDPTKTWAFKYGTLEMGRYPALHSLFAAHGVNTQCFIFADDENTEIVQDAYEEPLKELPLFVLRGFIQEELKRGVEYRMLNVLDGICKAFEDVNEKFFHGNIVVLHYGH